MHNIRITINISKCFCHEIISKQHLFTSFWSDVLHPIAVPLEQLLIFISLPSIFQVTTLLSIQFFLSFIFLLSPSSISSSGHNKSLTVSINHCAQNKSHPRDALIGVQNSKGTTSFHFFSAILIAYWTYFSHMNHNQAKGLIHSYL